MGSSDPPLLLETMSSAPFPLSTPIYLPPPPSVEEGNSPPMVIKLPTPVVAPLVTFSPPPRYGSFFFPFSLLFPASSSLWWRKVLDPVKTDFFLSPPLLEKFLNRASSPIHTPEWLPPPQQSKRHLSPRIRSWLNLHSGFSINQEYFPSSFGPNAVIFSLVSLGTVLCPLFPDRGPTTRFFKPRGRFCFIGVDTFFRVEFRGPRSPPFFFPRIRITWTRSLFPFFSFYTAFSFFCSGDTYPLHWGGDDRAFLQTMLVLCSPLFSRTATGPSRNPLQKDLLFTKGHRSHFGTEPFLLSRPWFAFRFFFYK